MEEIKSAVSEKEKMPIDKWFSDVAKVDKFICGQLRLVKKLPYGEDVSEHFRMFLKEPALCVVMRMPNTGKQYFIIINKDGEAITNKSNVVCKDDKHSQYREEAGFHIFKDDDISFIFEEVAEYDEDAMIALMSYQNRIREMARNNGMATIFGEKKAPNGAWMANRSKTEPTSPVCRKEAEENDEEEQDVQMFEVPLPQGMPLEVLLRMLGLL